MAFRTEVRAVRLHVAEGNKPRLQFYPDPTWHPAKECTTCKGWGVFFDDGAHGDRGDLCPDCDGIGAVVDG